MSLVYFEGLHGVVALDRNRVIGAEECRKPTDMPTRVLIDCEPYSIRVRNSFDDVQKRLIAGQVSALEAREALRDRCIDLVASYGGPVDLEAAIRAA